MKQLFHAADFLDRTRKKLRFGAYSRKPLLLLRFEWKGDSVECDWLARSPDSWDKELPKHVARKNETLQAFADGLNLRETIFKAFPAVSFATLRMFRPDIDHQLELMMTGNVSRNNEVLQRVASIFMRARLCGFQFKLEEGVLESLSSVV